MIKSAYILCLPILILLLSSCVSNPGPVKNARETESLEQIIFNKARAAFIASNFKTAATLFDPLAGNGNADAQYTMGYLYYEGKGVNRNLNKAMEWFTLSAKQGHLDAITAISLIKIATQGKTSKGMTATEKTTAVADQGISHKVIDLRKSSIVQTPASVTTQTPASVTTPRHVHPASTVYDVLPKPLSDPINIPPAGQTGQHTFPVPSEEESKQWINNQTPGSYTIQLASNIRKKPVLKYIRHVALDDVFYFKSHTGDSTRYHVIHGHFQKFEQATRKLKRLHQRGFKNAWIRNIDMIKDIISKSGR